MNDFLAQAQAGYRGQNGGPAAAQQMALQSLDNLRLQQSSALAYFDSFVVFAVVSAGLVALLFFMQPSVTQKGAHVAAE